MFVFFFFQAEDGIRDRDVTGVQTCALPISIVVSAVQVAGDLVGLAGAEDEGVVGEVEIGGAGQVQMVVERDLAQSRFELGRSEEHTSELQSHHDLVCRLLLEKKKKKKLPVL